MSNYIEYNDTIAFHPGYYIKEIIDESGLTQEDFAKRLDTTPKNLSLLIRGEQSLSIDIAMKLSRMIGTSVNYWLNLQNAYDALIAEFKSEEELDKERIIFEYLDYKYFRDNYGLPDLSGKTDEQIKAIRKFLNVATNKSLKTEAPKFNKKKFQDAVKYALTLTRNHEEFYTLIRKAFMEAGVIFVILPNIEGSKTNGATKKIGDNIMLMVNDRKLNADSFWFTLFHEIGHIINGDYGISFDKETGQQEEAADIFAEDNLIPREQYIEFVQQACFDLQSIREFADSINRDPGIVLGRLQNDKKVDSNDWTLEPLRHKYKVRVIV